METYDTLTASRQLEESGMERIEAESIVRTIQSMVKPLATKADVSAESKALRADMAAESRNLRIEIESTEHKLTAKMHELAVAQTWRLVGAVFAINSIFFAMRQTFG